MLSLYETTRGRRREFLKVGGLGLGGLTLSQLLQAQAAGGPAARFLKDRAVVFLFCHGGPSQIETFDPKMTAPSEIRSATGEVSTTIPGVTFGGTLPKLAALAKQLTVVRSFSTGDGNHDIKPIVCKDTLNANIGSLYARVVGNNHPVTGIPTNVAIFPQSVDAKTGPAQDGFGKFTSTGSIGAGYTPFVPGSGGPMQDDMTLRLSRNRMDDRRELLRGLDQIRRGMDTVGMGRGLDAFRDQAFETILGGVARAFDLAQEDPRVVARYDTARLMRPDMIDKKWTNYKHYVDHNQSLGKLMLLSRRLVEAGCGFVTVTTNFVWDNHGDSNNTGIAEGMQYCSLALDHAVSTFLEDVADRGLSDKILLVVTGEMGRTPRINKSGGRDHWGGLAPLLLAGGKLEMGRVIGQSTRDAGSPLTERVTIHNLVSTILHSLFDISEMRLSPSVPSEILRLANSAVPIPGLG
ncbi:MAG: DUF1501 domain-containing protein [Planctomycetota bacterium]